MEPQVQERDGLGPTFYPQDQDSEQPIQNSLAHARALWSNYETDRQDPSALHEMICFLTPIVSDIVKPGQLLQNYEESHLCESLTSAQDELFAHTGVSNWLLDSARLRRAYIPLLSPGHPGRVWACVKLMWNLRAMLQLPANTDSDLVAGCIQCLRVARSLCPLDDPSTLEFLTEFGYFLQFHHEITGDMSVLLENIQLDKILSEQDPSKADVWVNRAMHCGTLWDLTHETRILDEAIDHARHAVSLSQSIGLTRAHTLITLAALLNLMYDSTGDRALLEEKLVVGREALETSDATMNIQAQIHSLTGLARTLIDKWRISRENTLLDEAVQLQRRAFEATPRGSSRWSALCNNYAETLSLKAAVSNDNAVELLRTSVNLTREMMDLCSPNMSKKDRTMFTINLSNREFYLHRAQCNAGQDTCLKSIDALCNEAIAMGYPQYHWLARHIQVSIHLHRGADPQRPLTLLSQSLSSQYIQDLMQVMDAMIKLVEELHDVYKTQIERSLLPLVASLVRLMPRIAGYAMSRSGQLSALRRLRQIGTDVFACALAADQVEAGLELMEQAHGFLWSQTVHIQDPDFNSLPPDVAARLAPLIRPLRAGKGNSSVVMAEWQTQRDMLHQSSRQLEDMVSEIRNTPGLERFWLGSTIDELKQTARNYPVVILVEGRYQHHAVVIKSRNHDIQVIPIDIDPSSNPLTALRLITRSDPCVSSQIVTVDEERGMKVRQPPQQKTNYDKLQRLWERVAKPVIKVLSLEKRTLKQRPRLHWCPTGAFTFLPLHAAGVYSGTEAESCADYFVSSYTPTLTALLRAQNQVISTIKTDEIDLLLVAESLGCDASLGPIHGVEDELDIIQNCARLRGVENIVTCRRGAATLEAVTSGIKKSAVVHLACHGTQNPSDPLSSGFHLRDGKLTISRLMEMELSDRFLAFLSACQTATGDQDQPDQAMHLGAAMLFTGFRSVVATMWSMNDTDGPLVARIFYDELFARNTIDEASVPYALDSAVARLRQNGALPDRWAPYIHMGA